MFDRPNWRRKTQVPPFVPGQERYPFEFPVIVASGSGGDIHLHESAETFRWCGPDLATADAPPAMDVFACDGRAWRPLRLAGAVPSEKKIFGRRLYQAAYDYGPPGQYELSELQARVAENVVSDPDDLWTPPTTHEALAAAILATTSFEDLVRLIKASR